jgi:hypothetical protein
MTGTAANPANVLAGRAIFKGAGAAIGSKAGRAVTRKIRSAYKTVRGKATDLGYAAQGARRYGAEMLGRARAAATGAYENTRAKLGYLPEEQADFERRLGGMTGREVDEFMAPQRGYLEPRQPRTPSSSGSRSPLTPKEYQSAVDAGLTGHRLPPEWRVPPQGWKPKPQGPNVAEPGPAGADFELWAPEKPPSYQIRPSTKIRDYMKEMPRPQQFQRNIGPGPETIKAMEFYRPKVEQKFANVPKPTAAERAMYPATEGYGGRQVRRLAERMTESESPTYVREQPLTKAERMVAYRAARRMPVPRPKEK